MAARNQNRRSIRVLASWATSGLFALALVSGPMTALAATGPAAASQDQSTAPAVAAKPAATNSLVAVDGSDSRPAAESRQPAPRGNGSLILMELRTHRGIAKSALAPAAELDPRTKPLGW